MPENNFFDLVKSNIIRQIVANKFTALMAVLILFYLSYCLVTKDLSPKETFKTKASIGVIVFFGLIRPILLVFSLPSWLKKFHLTRNESPIPRRAIKSGAQLVNELDAAGFYSVAVEDHRQYVMDKQQTGFDHGEELFVVDHPGNEVGDFVSMDRRLWFFDAKSINYTNGLRDFLLEAHDVFTANGLEMKVSDAIDERGSDQYHRTTEITINSRRYIVFTDQPNSRSGSGVRLLQIINEECKQQGLDVRCYVHRESIILINKQQAEIIQSAYNEPYYGIQDEEKFVQYNLSKSLPPMKIIPQ